MGVGQRYSVDCRSMFRPKLARALPVCIRSRGVKKPLQYIISICDLLKLPLLPLWLVFLAALTRDMKEFPIDWDYTIQVRSMNSLEWLSRAHKQAAMCFSWHKCSEKIKVENWRQNLVIEFFQLKSMGKWVMKTLWVEIVGFTFHAHMALWSTTI